VLVCTRTRSNTGNVRALNRCTNNLLTTEGKRPIRTVEVL
jgi:hypothetical protein